MDLLHFTGLNCYQSCLVTIAQHFSIDFSSTFSTLWSETDLLYENEFNIFSSRRIIQNLAVLGLKIEKVLWKSPSEVQAMFNSLKTSELSIVGINAFDTPWNPVYMISHHPHFFMIQKTTEETFACFDPSYEEKSAQMACADIVSHISELHLIKQTQKHSLPLSAKQEAKAILQKYAATGQMLKENIRFHADDNQLLLLGQYINAMINNRYLYRHYLNNTPFCGKFFGDEYFLRWKCIKN